jgi:hypothetical protein
MVLLRSLALSTYFRKRITITTGRERRRNFGGPLNSIRNMRPRTSGMRNFFPGKAGFRKRLPRASRRGSWIRYRSLSRRIVHPSCMSRANMRAR